MEDGKVFLNDNVEIIITDIETSNGVIHVIDTGLLLFKLQPMNGHGLSGLTDPGDPPSPAERTLPEPLF